jgi:hypothetical protein
MDVARSEGFMNMLQLKKVYVTFKGNGEVRIIYRDSVEGLIQPE